MENKSNGVSDVKRGSKRRVVLFPLPLQGHLNPMMQMASILHDRGGFSITIVHTEFNAPNSSKYPHFTFRSIHDGVTEKEQPTEDVIGFLKLINVTCVEPFKNLMEELLASNTGDGDDKIACLITDAVWPFTQAIADSLKIPRLVLRTTSICSFHAFASIPPLWEKGLIPIPDAEPDTPVPELAPLTVKDFPVIQTKEPEKSFPSMKGMLDPIKVSSGLIWNSFLELEETSLNRLREEFPIPHFAIGPFHKYFSASTSSLMVHDKSAISWLDKQQPKSVLYVSFGSREAVTEKDFTEMAWSLANSKVPFLWVVRPGSVHGSKWLEALPEGYLEMVEGRGHIVKWAAQQDVLAHPSVGAYWTHNGWNSTLESICEGVPMICQPYFGDQLINARYVCDVWRIGLHLEKKVEREEMVKAIKRIMEDDEGQEMRDRILILKEKLDTSLKKGGSSYQSLESLIDHILSF